MPRKPILFLLACAALVVIIAVWYFFTEPPQHVAPEPHAAAPIQEPLRPPARTRPEHQPARAEIEPDPSAPSTSNNAADIYRRAFTLLARADLQSCEQIQPIVALVHEATAMTNCDWKLPMVFDRRMSQDFPQAIPEKLARVVISNATRCRQQDVSGVERDFETALRIVHTMPEFPPLESQRARIRIIESLEDYLAKNGSHLPAEVANRLAGQLAGDSYDEWLYQAVEAESELTRQAAERVATSSGRQARELFARTALWPDDTHDPAQMAQLLLKMSELQRDFVEHAGGSDAEYRDWVEKWKDAKGQNSNLNETWSELEQARDRTQRATVLRTMTMAGMAAVQGGKDALNQYLDPASGQPFVYRQTADGFELESAYQWNAYWQGRPVVMTFRTR